VIADNVGRIRYVGTCDSTHFWVCRYGEQEAMQPWCEEDGAKWVALSFLSYGVRSSMREEWCHGKAVMRGAYKQKEKGCRVGLPRLRRCWTH
jgi:hypothetical protein